MKLVGSRNSLIFAALLLKAGSAPAEDSNAVSAAPAASDSPYAAIVARNMFGLLPIPPPDPTAGQPPPEEPPKITPNGTMTIFGRKQALFKVANKPKPGQQAKEASYVLAEGERQDDITVVKIDTTLGIITFDNHGKTQELPLVAAKDTGGGAAGSGGRPGGFGQPNQPRPLGVPPGGNLPGRPPIAGGLPGGINPAGNPGMAANAGGVGPEGIGPNGANGGITMLGGTPVNANRIYQPMEDSTITPEQSVILIEAQRMKAFQTGDSRTASLLPTTPLTEQNQRENAAIPPMPTP